MKFINCTTHLDLEGTSDIDIYESSFYTIKSENSLGGAIFINSTVSLNLVKSVFDSCTVKDEGGGIYSITKNCKMRNLCFNSCYHLRIEGTFDGCAFYCSQGETEIASSSIWKCGPIPKSGYSSARIEYAKVNIENLNVSNCVNSYVSSFSIFRPLVDSSMKNTQISDMTNRATQFDYASSLTCSMINLVNNTQESCSALYLVFTDSSEIMTFTQVVFWKNYKNIKEESAHCSHKFIKCVSDTDFSGFNAISCSTSASMVELHPVAAPISCGEESKESVCQRLSLKATWLSLGIINSIFWCSIYMRMNKIGFLVASKRIRSFENVRFVDDIFVNFTKKVSNF